MENFSAMLFFPHIFIVLFSFADSISFDFMLLIHSVKHMESEKPFSSQKLDGGKGKWAEVAGDLFGFLSD